MRLFVSLAVLGLVSATVPAMAQQTTTTTQPQAMYGVPMYNSTGNSYYQGTPSGAPVYNNGGARPLPLNQIVAGKNAPSYNYNQNNAYTGFGASGNPLAGADYGNLTSEQSRYIDQQREYRAQQEQQAYMQSMQQVQQQQQTWQQQPQQGAVGYMQGLNQGYNPFAQPEEKPKQRRVVYNERNNPLATPPRLFNPDQ